MSAWPPLERGQVIPIQFEVWAIALNLPPAGREIVERIRSKAVPSALTPLAPYPAGNHPGMSFHSREEALEWSRTEVCYLADSQMLSTDFFGRNLAKWSGIPLIPSKQTAWSWEKTSPPSLNRALELAESLKPLSFEKLKRIYTHQQIFLGEEGVYGP